MAVALLRSGMLATGHAILAAVPLLVLQAVNGQQPAERSTVLQSACIITATRTLSSDHITSCQLSDVELRLDPTCAGRRLNVVLVLLGYANPALPEANWNRSWTNTAIDALEMEKNPSIRVGVVYVRNRATILTELTDREDKVRSSSRVEYIGAGSRPDAWPCYACGFDRAEQVLRGEERSNNVIVFIGSMVGPPLIAEDDDSYYRDWVRGARTAKAAARTFVVGCTWKRPNCSRVSDWWKEATTGFFFEGIQGSFGASIQDIVRDTSPPLISSISVRDRLPPQTEFVIDSARPPLTRVDSDSADLHWSFSAPITSGIPVVMTYTVRPRPDVLTPIVTDFTDGTAVLTDTTGLTRTVLAATTSLTITEPCAPTASSTPPPTDTPAPTPTPEPTATTRPSPTATATPILAPLYLPVALSEAPCTRTQRADVVLVIDASTSMNELAGDGRTKLVAARDAARLFLDRLRLDAGDQAAVVGFNRDARLLVGLTDDRPALDDALARLETASETCLVCGLEAASAALGSDARRPGNSAVVILLTDGRSNPRPASEAVEEATRLEALGHVIFTIGLGADLDDDALVAIASRPAFAHRASDGAALEAIYREIAVILPGPADCYWGRRP